MKDREVKDVIKMKKILLFTTALLISVLANATTILLVNGIGSPNKWQETGIYQRLEATYPTKIVSMPYWNSIQNQSKVLNNAIGNIDDNVIIVAHSAGGLVARHLLVNYKNKKVTGLITLATPHLGSKTARVSDFINNKAPFGNIFTRLFIQDSNRTRNMVSQLKINSPLITRLRTKPHPDIYYSSIIKTGGKINNAFAHPYAQNMRNINLKSDVFLSTSGHGLATSDFGLIDKSIKRYLEE